MAKTRKTAGPMQRDGKRYAASFHIVNDSSGSTLARRVYEHAAKHLHTRAEHVRILLEIGLRYYDEVQLENARRFIMENEKPKA